MKRIVDKIKTIDEKAYRLYINKIQQGRYLGLRKFCLWIGLPVPLLIMLLGIAYVASLFIGYRSIIVETLAYLFSSAINLIFKAANKRNRPPKNTFWSPIPFDHYSFPSGHAAGTMSVAVCLGIIIPSLFIPLIIWSVLIGLSRFLGGYHHPSDILGGFVVGIVAAFGLIRVLALMGF